MIYFKKQLASALMFGLNIFENRKPPAENPSEQQKDEDVNELRSDHVFHDLNDFLGIEKVSNTITLNDFGINTDIRSLFSKEIPDITQPEESESQNEIIEGSIETSQQSESIFEILPTENTPFIEQLEDVYTNSIFAKTALKVLKKRNLPDEVTQEKLKHLVQKNARKSLEAFKGIAKQELLESGPADLDIENYIYWRLSAFTENIRYVLEFSGSTGVLSAENFYSPELFELFNAEKTAYNLKDSYDIENLYQKINED